MQSQLNSGQILMFEELQNQIPLHLLMSLCSQTLALDFLASQ